MAKQVQWRRGSTDAHATFVGANGEITIDTNKKTLVVHDGVTLGGSVQATEKYVNDAIETIDTSNYPSKDYTDGLDAQNVKLTGNQTINEVKTFTSNPMYTGTQFTDGHALIKKEYFDGLDAQNVKLTGNQTINEVKTFTSSPIVPTPTATTQAANKEYVDSNLSSYIPRGLISLWSGSIASIPTGWALCNGTNGTPDLRDRFIVGAGSTYGVGTTGGSKDAVAVAHTHTGSTASGGGSGSFVTDVYVSSDITGGRLFMGGTSNSTSVFQSKGAASAHAHSLTIDSSGVSGVDKNLPPYYALAYIMKL